MSDPKRVVEPDTMKEELEHKAVNLMAELMKKELEANKEFKGGREGWLKLDSMSHVLQTYYHTGKLQVALKELQTLQKTEGSKSEIDFRREQVKEYAADVANHALMVLDALGLLGLPKPRPEKKPERKGRSFNSDDVGY